VGFGFPFPDFFGDPQALRAVGQQLRGLSAKVGSLQDSLSGTVRAMTFEGPAGEAFAARAGGVGGRLSGASGELAGFAGEVDAAADRIEAEQRALLRALEAKAQSSLAGNG
jgi:ABC-type transporter Mla subunit MlaD